MNDDKLSELDVEELIAGYGAAALQHRVASRKGGYKVANRAYERLVSRFREIRSRGLHAQKQFMRLLQDDRIEVRGWAAVHALELDPDGAAKVLDSIASGPPSLEQFSASMVLQEWRSGNLKFP